MNAVMKWYGSRVEVVGWTRMAHQLFVPGEWVYAGSTSCQASQDDKRHIIAFCFNIFHSAH